MFIFGFVVIDFGYFNLFFRGNLVCIVNECFSIIEVIFKYMINCGFYNRSLLFVIEDIFIYIYLKCI